MANSSKRKGGSKQTASKTIIPDTKRVSTELPEHFKLLPDALQSFCAPLPKDHFYITSIDRHEAQFKRRLFLVPLLLNLFLTLCVLYRVACAAPVYFNILISTLGYDSPEKIPIKGVPANSLMIAGLSRTFMFFGDFLLLRFLALWPYNFFLGTGFFSGRREYGPVAWRRAVSFRSEEVVVRRSRRWDILVFYKPKQTGTQAANIVLDTLRAGPMDKNYRDRIIPAVSKTWIAQKSAYQMLDQNWDLYFTGMINAHTLIGGKKNKLDDFRTQVLVYTETWGWIAWDVAEDYEVETSAPNQGSSQAGDVSPAQRWEDLKTSLCKIGKENLFYRMIEVIQSETSRVGALTAEGQKRIVQDIRQEFEDHKVDFDLFWSTLPGLETMPGLEIRA